MSKEAKILKDLLQVVREKTYYETMETAVPGYCNDTDKELVRLETEWIKKWSKDIEKQLEALEIIKEKRVDACNCLMILNGRTDDLSFEDYSKLFLTDLIKEEYDLLKELL